jgi:hypothetical protein
MHSSARRYVWRINERAETCRLKAHHCERASSLAVTLEARLMYSDLAEQWRALARQRTSGKQHQSVSSAGAPGCIWEHAGKYVQEHMLTVRAYRARAVVTRQPNAGSCLIQAQEIGRMI